MKTSIRTSIVTALLFASAAANAVTPITPGGVFRAGQTATLPIGETDDTWQVLDDARYPDGIVEIASGSAAYGGTLTLPHSALNERLGAFLLRSWNHGGTTTNETRFAFIPPGYVGPVRWVGTNSQYSDKCWGYGDAGIVDGLLDLAAEAGIGIFRDGATWGGGTEPSPGEYATTEKFEHFVDALNARGLALCYLLGFQHKTAYPDNPINATAFANWAYWVAGHFAGRIDTYDIYNEPWNFYYWEWYINNVEQVTDKANPGFLRHFATFSRTVDDALAGRGLRVGVGGGPDSQKILTGLITNGVARPRNFVSIHPYGGGTVKYPEKATWLKDGFAELRDILAANGAAGARIAITEDGWSNYRPGENMDDGRQANYFEQAARIVRMYLIAKAADAEFACQFCFKDVDHNRSTRTYNYGLLDYYGHPKPSYAAVATMTRFVGEAEFVEELSTNAETYRIQHFRRDDGTDIYVTWNVDGDRTISISQDVRNALKPATFTFDIYGNKIASPRNGIQLYLTEDPVYFVAGSAAGNDEAPWGPPWAISATSEPMMVFGNGRESLLWHTSSFGGTTLHWDMPVGATSATLTIEGSNYRRTWTGLTGESLEVSLPTANGNNEDVYTMTIAFDDGTAQTAYVGAVTGLGKAGMATAPHVKMSSTPEWPRFQKKAVMAIPFGARALTVDGNPVPDLDGSAGWRMLKSARSDTDVGLSLTLNGAAEPIDVTLRATGGPSIFILH